MTLDEAIDGACARIAPLWPLRHFGAVNPFLGFSGHGFAETCATLRRVAGVDMPMPRHLHRDAIADLPEHLRSALPAAPLPPPRPRVATVAQVLDALAGGDRLAARTAFMIDEISKWCASYFDQGQALALHPPDRSLPPYQAWRSAMRHDRNPEAMGIAGFRAAVAAMPDDPRAAIAEVVGALGIPSHAVLDYLYRALFDIGGWAGHVRYLVWDNALHGRPDDRLVDLLAIRVVWGFALFQERRDAAFKSAWSSAMAAAEPIADDGDLDTDLALLAAREGAYQRRLFSMLRNAVAETKPLVQAAFCIDVRSEPFRRALETVAPGVETLGFAGFFGYPIEYVPIGNARGNAQCPVLLKPAFIVCEAVVGAEPDEASEILCLRLLRRRAGKAWKAFKQSAVSCFTYVEAAGLLFAPKIAADALGLSRPVPDPRHEGLDTTVIDRLVPALEPRIVGGRETGFTPEQRLRMAEAVLRAMSLTNGFARLVLLVGHGSTSANNPHASGLDCGACGGHSGEANARVAAAILNDPAVRVGLARRGIVVPMDTWFLGALHDTTMDEVRLFDTAAAPLAFAQDIKALAAHLAEAGLRTRKARSAALGAKPDRLAARGRDWSQVRPEWGLAGNAAFIAAPRSRTRGADLAGRVFLHSYDWRRDQEFQTLALIMTAPMVVASWINLQYYAATIDNRTFGAGNKVLHNVTGLVGVREGNGGDLRPGLPWQSVHDGRRFVHEPLRLSVLIEAPREAIENVLAQHQGVRDLVRNEWLHLFAIADDGAVAHYTPKGHWENAAPG